MSKKISKISLESFRGASTKTLLEFDSQKNTAVIFGENGTGKSTIVDAIDFVFNGKYGSLEDKSLGQGSKKHELIASLGKLPDKIKIEVVYDNKTIIGSIGEGNRPVTIGITERPRVDILRKADILTLINHQPKDRYDALKDFIDVPICAKNEKTLREANIQAKKDYDDIIKEVTSIHEAINRAWEANGSLDGDSLNWAKTLANTDLTDLEEKTNSYSLLLQKIEKAGSTLARLDKFDEEIRNVDAEIKETTDKLKESLGGTSNKLLEVLKSAQRYVEENKTLSMCPVCEQSVISKQLIDRIVERLDVMQNAIHHADELQKFRLQLVHSNNNRDTSKKEYETIIKELVAHASKVDEIKLIKFIDSILYYREINKYYDVIRTHSLKLGKESNLLSTIKSQTSLLNEKMSEAEFAKKRLDNLGKCLKIVEEKRKEYVDKVLTDISGEIDRLYLMLHPDEKLGEIKFKVDPSQQSSLHLEAKFQSVKVLPQAYYSESHLDTLGVCIFIALAKHYQSDIVILDDIISSADQSHIERFIRLLHDEANNFNQIIITTHYRPWRDRYRNSQGPTNNIQLIELLKWGYSHGLRHTKTKLSIDEIRDLLGCEPIARQAIASTAGILLESLFDNFALKFSCRLPKQAVPHTLFDYLNCLERKLKDNLSVELSSGTIIQLAPLINKIADTAFIRNLVGCHYNEVGAQLSDDEVMHFGNAVVNLSSSITCSNCGALPDNDKSGSYWSCSCGGIKLHPLKTPK